MFSLFAFPLFRRRILNGNIFSVHRFTDYQIILLLFIDIFLVRLQLTCARIRFVRLIFHPMVLIIFQFLCYRISYLSAAAAAAANQNAINSFSDLHLIPAQHLLLLLGNEHFAFRSEHRTETMQGRHLSRHRAV